MESLHNTSYVLFYTFYGLYNTPCTIHESCCCHCLRFNVVKFKIVRVLRIKTVGNRIMSVFLNWKSSQKIYEKFLY